MANYLLTVVTHGRRNLEVAGSLYSASCVRRLTANQQLRTKPTQRKKKANAFLRRVQ